MERLSKAIERARAERLARGTVKPDATPRSRTRATAERTGADTAWLAMEELEFDSKLLFQNRVMTVKAGQDSAPFDLLRTRLVQTARQNSWRRIAIVSPHKACGKSTTCANLAFSMARQRDLKSMVLDCDLRKRGLTRIFGQEPAAGTAEMLQGSVDIADVGRRFGDNLIMCFADRSTGSPSEILQSSSARAALDNIQRTYQPDIMIFDMPPLMASDDNFGFLQNVDAALILVAAEMTTNSQIDVAERQVADLTNVMGIVLNRCRYTDGAYGHEYGYY
ncbi:MAG: CpsD/CapB family tyrosine-protein kinase [Pseudomonadota bacterium]